MQTGHNEYDRSRQTLYRLLGKRLPTLLAPEPEVVLEAVGGHLRNHPEDTILRVWGGFPGRILGVVHKLHEEPGGRGSSEVVAPERGIARRLQWLLQLLKNGDLPFELGQSHLVILILSLVQLDCHRLPSLDNCPLPANARCALAHDVAIRKMHKILLQDDPAFGGIHNRARLRCGGCSLLASLSMCSGDLAMQKVKSMVVLTRRMEPSPLESGHSLRSTR
mmetsp:Transcript_93144/g.207185  ORF Transcript_93144/g.207185 Transcript_93144/m.207185 type:complete len:221 (-) Transcript_93144:285-947(-)